MEMYTLGWQGFSKSEKIQWDNNFSHSCDPKASRNPNFTKKIDLSVLNIVPYIYFFNFVENPVTLILVKVGKENQMFLG